MVRRFLAMVPVVGLLLVGSMGVTGAQPVPLRVALAGDEGPLNPWTFRTFTGYKLLTMLYDTLFWLDQDGQVIPWLVESYHVTEDGLTWTLQLREGLTWHDGQPLTAEDVRFTYEYAATHRHPNWTPAATPIQAIEVLDATTLVLTLNAFDSSFLASSLANLPILPQHIWSGIDNPATAAPVPSVGSGPYRLVDYQPDQFYLLAANEHYFLGPPAVPEVVLPIIGNASAAFLALRSGELDAVMRSAPPELAVELEQTPGVNVLRGSDFTTVILQFNNERPPFDQREFRRALAMAINQEELVDILLLGRGTPGSPGFVHPATPWASPGAATPLYYPELGNILLDQLGYWDVDGDGVRETPGGGRLEFDLLVQANDPLRIRAAELISQSLLQVGVVANPRVLEFATVQSALFPDQDACQPRQYDMAIWGRSALTQQEPVWLQRLFHSDCRIGPNNQAAYNSPVFDWLATAQAETVDPEERIALVRLMQNVLAEDAPIVSLYHPDGLYAYRPERYDGWVYIAGVGIFDKLSFLPAVAAPAQAHWDPGAQIARLVTSALR